MWDGIEHGEKTEIKAGLTLPPKTILCHSEPFERLRINSVKNLCRQTNYEILRRPAFSGTPQNDIKNTVSGWKPVKLSSDSLG